MYVVVCMGTCMSVMCFAHVCAHVYKSVYVNASTCGYVSLCLYVSMCRQCVCICDCLCNCVHVYMCVRVWVYVSWSHWTTLIVHTMLCSSHWQLWEAPTSVPRSQPSSTRRTLWRNLYFLKATLNKDWWMHIFCLPRAETQVPTMWAFSLKHPLPAAFPSQSLFHSALLAFPVITSQRNNLHQKPCLSITSK